ncbi:MAG: hypothetical protein HKO53_14115, partial [Gemmatimonadetes bacterium]|nr:hypothetical protein [Gemmatimonadota bacterium]
AYAAADEDHRAHQMGDHLAYRARIEVVLGNHERALALLSEALQRGVDDLSWFHARAHHDLLPLTAEPRFQRLMTPTGP